MMTCTTVLAITISATNANSLRPHDVSSDAPRRPATSLRVPQQGGVAGIPGTTDCSLTEDFESFPVGPFDLVGGWAGSTFGGNMFIVDDQAGCEPIQGVRSAVHVSNGSTGPGFEMDSPLFGPCFQPMTLRCRRTAAPEQVDPPVISTYQIVSLDTGSGFFNTRVQFEPNGDIAVGQLDTNEEPPTFVFFNTGLSWEQDTVYQVCIELNSLGDLNVFIDEELALQGLSASRVAIDEGLADPGDAYEGHGQYRTFSDNIGTGVVVDPGTPGDPTDDRATCEGDNFMVDEFGLGCGGSVPLLCPGDTNDDGAVDVDDLINVVLCWGTDGIPDENGGGCAALEAGEDADVIDDREVNVDDLVEGVILNWGFCTPVNDACANAELLFFPGTFPFDTRGASNSELADPMCASGIIGPDIFFRFTVSLNANSVTFEAAADPRTPDYNPVVEVFIIMGDETCVDLGPPVCDLDSGPGNNAQVVCVGQPRGTEYLIRISGVDADGRSAASGAGLLTIEATSGPGAPANDDCSNATPLLISDLPVDGQILTATVDDEAFNCGVSGGGPGVWYSFVGNGNELTVSMCASEAVYDSTLQVYCGTPEPGPGPDCADGLECIGGDNDGCGDPGEVSIFTFCSEADRPYLVRVSGFDPTDSGNFSIQVIDGAPCAVPDECTPEQPLLNDDCADAIPIAQGLTPYITIEATTDGPAHPESCEQANDGGATTEDIWFIYTAQTTSVLQVTTCPDVVCIDTLECAGDSPDANHDTDIVVYAGTSCDEADLLANLLACNDDDPLNPCGTPRGGFKSNVLVPVDAGEAYLIRLGSWFTSNNGSGTLLVQEVLPTDVFCQFAATLEPGGDPAVLTPADGDGDLIAPSCDGKTPPPSDPASWVQVFGDGTRFTLSTCGIDGSCVEPGDVRLTVYCGPCSELLCAGAPVDDNSGASPCFTTDESISWDTFPGAEYLVLIESMTSDCSYEVSLTSSPSEGNPPCFGPDECGGVLYQPRRLPNDDWLFAASDDEIGLQRFESFTWAGGDVESVRVWGADLRFVLGIGLIECMDPITTPTLEFELSIHADAGGQPDLIGPALTTQALVPQVTPLEAYGSTPFQSYAYDFDLTPATLPPGDYWISVRDVDGNVCFFFWLDSRIGDDVSWVEEDGVLTIVQRDLSLCINGSTP